ncbi:unnamed protein product [Auanema sp. JU1783]|nr:unnamed protein product [Auanema sp. JU1783]
MSEEIVLNENFDNNNNANAQLAEDAPCSEDSYEEKTSSTFDPTQMRNAIISPTLSAKKQINNDYESIRKRKPVRSPRKDRTSTSCSDSSRSSSRSYKRLHKRSRRSRSCSSSSRGTFDGLNFDEDEHNYPYTCSHCKKGYHNTKDLASHEVRVHYIRAYCAICPKVTNSLTKLSSHMLLRHPTKDVECHYCQKNFDAKCEDMSRSDWHDFRAHIQKELVKRKTIEHDSRGNSRYDDNVAFRGVGKCPHGAPVKCKNFPHCPGSRCIYSHGLCRYDSTCNKQSCPFDHTSRPRVCLSCANDSRSSRKKRRD